MGLKLKVIMTDSIDMTLDEFVSDPKRIPMKGSFGSFRVIVEQSQRVRSCRPNILRIKSSWNRKSLWFKPYHRRAKQLVYSAERFI